MKILITGCAGFLGFSLARRLLGSGGEVVGVDNVNAYYSVALKEARVRLLAEAPSFRFERLDLRHPKPIDDLLARERPEAIVHFAAQAGVRYSLREPAAYVEDNVLATVHLLEAARRASPPPHLLYASSSSVYGLNASLPFSVRDSVAHPASVYAATKRATELLAHSYSHLYRLPTTGLRFFTVYGPWGRPDMAYFSFTRAILGGEPIEVYGKGELRRDFTYVDDVIEAVARLIPRRAAADPGWDPAHPDPSRSSAPYRIFNIGNRTPLSVRELVEAIERAVGRRAILRFSPTPPGDVTATAADTTELEEEAGFAPSTPLAVGIERFVSWYREVAVHLSES
ncbi:NAD-dependent epimerase/dehydratase family protein [Methylacidimicrobium sp. B4]|uniref:NAD-dependent epimerase/dehydratase family protein n=1 Tax=Methylacidimicrobium sp. B4 TaxID=2796139 RepID=UPI001A8D78E8|nr:NAD-dependent epimerase/dehydratase family protein [Methylacidimicrobium sp. B4]QSR85590.1 NAD-dependent epimerase/dehydratase family protein [Methylacidimicrobium sp. B4]